MECPIFNHTNVQYDVIWRRKSRKMLPFVSLFPRLVQPFSTCPCKDIYNAVLVSIWLTLLSPHTNNITVIFASTNTVLEEDIILYTAGCTHTAIPVLGNKVWKVSEKALQTHCQICSGAVYTSATVRHTQSDADIHFPFFHTHTHIFIYILNKESSPCCGNRKLSLWNAIFRAVSISNFTLHIQRVIDLSPNLHINILSEFIFPCCQQC